MTEAPVSRDRRPRRGRPQAAARLPDQRRAGHQPAPRHLARRADPAARPRPLRRVDRIGEGANLQEWTYPQDWIVTGPSVQRISRATSSIRLEKPHSLSYQPKTRSIPPRVTRVSGRPSRCFPAAPAGRSTPAAGRAPITPPAAESGVDRLDRGGPLGHHRQIHAETRGHRHPHRRPFDPPRHLGQHPIQQPLRRGRGRHHRQAPPPGCARSPPPAHRPWAGCRCSSGSSSSTPSPPPAFVISFASGASALVVQDAFETIL
jgi:hypothetical protein